MLNPRLFRPQTPFDSAHNVRFTHEIRSPAFMAATGMRPDRPDLATD
jgi:hypothetical protein